MTLLFHSFPIELVCSVLDFLTLDLSHYCYGYCHMIHLNSSSSYSQYSSEKKYLTNNLEIQNNHFNNETTTPDVLEHFLGNLYSSILSLNGSPTNFGSSSNTSGKSTGRCLSSYFIRILFGYKRGNSRGNVMLLWSNIKLSGLRDWPYFVTMSKEASNIMYNEEERICKEFLYRMIPHASRVRSVVLNCKIESSVNFLNEYLQYYSRHELTNTKKLSHTLGKIDCSPFSSLIKKKYKFFGERMVKSSQLFHRQECQNDSTEQSFASLVRSGFNKLLVSINAPSRNHNFMSSSSLIEMPHLRYIDLSGLTFQVQGKTNNLLEQYVNDTVHWFRNLFSKTPNLQVFKLNYIYGNNESNLPVDEATPQEQFLFESIVNCICESNLTKLKELSMNGCGLSNKGFITILKRLRLKKVSLKYNKDITLDDPFYSDPRNANNYLQYLNLSYCELGYFSGFLDLISKILPSIKTLKIAGNNDMFLYTRTLNALLQNLSLEYLDLRSSPIIQDDDLKLSNKTRKLRLKLPKLESSTIKFVSSSFFNINFLEISKYSLSVSQIDEILGACRRQLTVLRLPDSHLTNDHAYCIARHMTSSLEEGYDGLTELDLSRNNIKDGGFNALWQSLPNLNIFKLGGNVDVSNNSFKNVAIPIKLHTLELACTKIGDNTACEWLFKSTSNEKKRRCQLTALDAHNTMFGDSLIDYVKNAQSLRYLDVSDSLLSKEAKQILRSSCLFISEIIV
ncbi:hypothetical protein C9374_006873 [Naegleria lovaniensis]|uniref:Uncharacterized protein n=1 Tax=Naegleria lovaniensis TaxID=51637 RepID=A0AA88H5Y8_NAELO|nr:uncharacterized protein C9374_006873 [Naegleria lovaniensis]KAG2393342.1 hypothetical protein C9374_006873 [Naegleria lovaniensis]